MSDFNLENVINNIKSYSNANLFTYATLSQSVWMYMGYTYIRYVFPNSPIDF